MHQKLQSMKREHTEVIVQIYFIFLKKLLKDQ